MFLTREKKEEEDMWLLILYFEKSNLFGYNIIIFNYKSLYIINLLIFIKLVQNLYQQWFMLDDNYLDGHYIIFKLFFNN